MKAVVYKDNKLPITDANSLYETILPKPQPGRHDLLVRVAAIAVNPVDTKVRRNAAVTEPRVLGWDAAGIVEAVGEDVSLFKPGDEVYYAGSLMRAGSYAEYALVDERIAGRKPASLSMAEAAALPLTSLTAWELLFDRLEVDEGNNDVLLIIGAGGGVGSILTQFAASLTNLTIVGTCSRPETSEWVKSLGAHHIIDHTQPFAPQLNELGISRVRYVASLTHTDKHYHQIVEVMAPQGRLAVIDDPETLDAIPLKTKSISLHWELMFTRSMFTTPDMQSQHHILTDLSELIDKKIIRTTLGEHFGTITAENIRRAHAVIESGKAKGKIALAGF
ncbi:zinc-binding alcohol dehydrogenase family protein [Pantoea agglomerans]|jgi:zinc-binding alcohol dehydrogenase family protein|uniref:zinc-binding alcohol dehydrogenase family protein n=1 Tax=Enterobacter agglomerans TaxID=549 RepID=UPI0010094311|nr:zinc-binding alcohol dehydrogenase family protein [Pantoea agglomerans]QAV47577.1 zinc-binding alcohol dehydrogenase family protein [Pantoea agglomerans]QAV52219.1 zinc-binding alcohol dehydrogenase family protein [Pantoea agglomerans]